MDAPAPSDALLRLCEVRPVAGGGGGDAAGSVPDAPAGAMGVNGSQSALGAVVAARWDPTHPRRIGVLYSSGTLRLWDVVADSRRDFALYIPAAGLPLAPPGRAGPAAIADRRAATPITHFDFLPLHTATGLPRIAFTVRHARRVYLADLPLPAASVPTTPEAPAAHLAGDHFLAGSRVYQLATPLPADATVIASWLVSPVQPTVTAALSIGCVDGSLLAWLISGAFNPEAVVAMRSRRDVSPAWLVAQPLDAGSKWPATAATPALGSGDGSSGGGEALRMPASSHVAHGGKRVRCLRPLALASYDDWAAVLRETAPPEGAPRVGPARFAAAHGGARAVACNTHFLTSGDDGAVTLWRLQLQLQAASAGAAPAAFALTLHKVVDLPTDGVPVTAITSVPWPLSTTTPQGGELLSLESVMSRRARKLLATSGTGAGSDIDLSAWALDVPPTMRAMVATGNKEGVVSVWELLVDGASTRLMVPDGSGGGGIVRPFLSAASLAAATPLSALASFAGAHALMHAANGRLAVRAGSIGGGASTAASAVAAPSIHLVALIHARSIDAVADLALSPPYADPAEPYKLAVAGVDGTLQVYRLVGSNGLDSDDVGGTHAGSAGPIVVELQGGVGDAETAATSAYDMIQHLGVEAAALRRLAATGFGSDDTSSESTTAAASTGGIGGGALFPPRLGRGTAADAASTISFDAESSGAQHVRVARALTVAALAGLRRAFVTCAFNDAARWYAVHVPGRAGVRAGLRSAAGDAADDATPTAALMACNGGGDVLLWPRDALPGDSDSSREDGGDGGDAAGEAVDGGGVSAAGMDGADEANPAFAAREAARAVLAAAGELPGVAASSEATPEAASGQDVESAIADLPATELPAVRSSFIPAAASAADSVARSSADVYAMRPVMPTAHARLYGGSSYDGDDGVPAPRPREGAPTPSRVHAGPRSVSKVSPGASTPTRVLSETEASRARRLAAEADAAVAEARAAGAATQQPTLRARSKSPAALREGLRQLRLAAEDTARPLSLRARSRSPLRAHEADADDPAAAGGAGPAELSVAQRFRMSGGALQVAAPALHSVAQTSARRPPRTTPVESWLDRTTRRIRTRLGVDDAIGVAASGGSSGRVAAEAVADAALETTAVSDPGTNGGGSAGVLNRSASTITTSASAGRAASRSRSASRSRALVGAAGPGGAASPADGGDGSDAEVSPPPPSFANPARVAAILQREAAEDARAAILSARESAYGGLGDDHPHAAGMYARVVARGPENHHHLVAPTVGSSASIAAEIARLQALRFDEAAELDAVACEWRVSDHLTLMMARQGLGLAPPATTSVAPLSLPLTPPPAIPPSRRGGGAAVLDASADSNRLVYQPTASGSAAASSSRGRARAAPSRLLQPTASKLARAKPTDTIGAEDLWAVHTRGTLRR